MNRWLLPPLVAALALAGSGFLDALEDTTRASAALARSARTAPAATRAAARGVADLPQAARLTGAQAAAFEALADALDVSAQRAFALNRSVARQARALRGLTAALKDLSPALACVRARLKGLLTATGPAPGTLTAIGLELERIRAGGRKALTHLVSINRKLAALGAAADLLGVRAPPPPPAGETSLSPGGSLPPLPCRPAA